MTLPVRSRMRGFLLANDLVDAAFLDMLSLKGTYIHAECPYE